MIPTTTSSPWMTAPVPRGLNVHERGPVLRGAEAASLSSRERAAALTDRALAGAPPTARSLVLELERSHGLCVLAMGDRPAAVWRFDVGALRGLAAAAGADVPRARALAGLREEASRVVLGMRLHALRGSVGDVVFVHDRPDAISRLVGTMLLDVIVEHVWLEETGVTGEATSGSFCGDVERRSA
jgi:hypothetical protein